MTLSELTEDAEYKAHPAVKFQISGQTGFG